MTTSARITRAAGLVLAAGLTLGGCAQPNLQVSGGEQKLPAGESSAAFLDRVAAGENVTQNDAMRGVLMLLDGKDEAGGFHQRVQTLADRGVVDRGWDFDAQAHLTRGQLAYMIYRACNVPGGVILALTGPSRRYCLRELQYQGFMIEGFAYTKISGMEYVAVLARAEAYVRTGEIPRELSPIRQPQPTM